MNPVFSQMLHQRQIDIPADLLRHLVHGNCCHILLQTSQTLDLCDIITHSLCSLCIKDYSDFKVVCKLLSMLNVYLAIVVHHSTMDGLFIHSHMFIAVS